METKHYWYLKYFFCRSELKRNHSFTFFFFFGTFQAPHLTFSRQVNPLTQRTQRLTPLVPTTHPLARTIIPIPTAIPAEENSVLTEPRTAATNGFHPAWFPHPVWPTVGALTHAPPTPPRPIGFEAQCLLSKTNVRTTTTSYLTDYPTADWASNPYASPIPTNVTPVGQKRKHPYTTFLPSPEPSPEGPYIGQHSQGIGGHYIDSWPKRKKKN